MNNRELTGIYRGKIMRGHASKAHHELYMQYLLAWMREPKIRVRWIDKDDFE